MGRAARVKLPDSVVTPPSGTTDHAALRIARSTIDRSSFMNFRVADIQACYELWKSRGAEFITEPIPKYGETRCYIRDPDGYLIEVGQSTDVTYG